MFCPFDQKEQLLGAGLEKLLHVMMGKVSVKRLGTGTERLSTEDKLCQERRVGRRSKPKNHRANKLFSHAEI